MPRVRILYCGFRPTNPVSSSQQSHFSLASKAMISVQLARTDLDILQVLLRAFTPSILHPALVRIVNIVHYLSDAVSTVQLVST